MGLTAKDNPGIKLDPTPQGLHLAICTGVFDLGMQYSKTFKVSSRKCRLQWEFPNVRIDIPGKDNGDTRNLPRAISMQYTLSLNEKANLRRDLESWRGKAFTKDELEGFELKNLLGVNCQIQVIHKMSDDGTKTYANIGSIVEAPKGTKMEAENPLRFFSFEENTDIPEGTPEWIIKEIQNSDEWKTKMNIAPIPVHEGEVVDEIVDDDLPF